MSDDRPAVYSDSNPDYIATYRASSFGSCLRRLFAARSNMPAKPPPDTMQTAFDEGTRLEPIILDLLYNDHNFTFADGGFQLTCSLIIDTPNGPVLILGHVDQYGCVYHDMPEGDAQRHLPIDVKAFAQSTIDDYRARGLSAFPHYAWQQSIYALALGHRYFYMPIYNKSTALIEPWSLEPVLAPYDLEDITNRVLSVELAFSTNQMPECTPAYPCPYYYLHDDAKDTPLEPPSPAVGLNTARIKLDRKIKALTNAKQTLTDAIIPHLTLDTPYTYDAHSIRVIPNPPRFNTNAAKALLTSADVDWQNDPEFIIPGVGVQLRVTPPKADKAGNQKEDDSEN